MELIIYGLPISNYVRSVGVLCHEAGISFSLSLAGATDVAHFRRDLNPGLHPFCRVPVLEHQGFRLYETTAILRYLDESLGGGRFVPDTAQERARMEQWLSAANAYFDGPIIRELVLPAYRAAQRGEDFDLAARAEAVEAACHALGVLGQALDGQAFVVGDRLSLADFLLLPIVDYAQRIAPLQQATEAAPGLSRWLSELRARPSFRAATARSVPTA